MREDILSLLTHPESQITYFIPPSMGSTFQPGVGTVDLSQVITLTPRKLKEARRFAKFAVVGAAGAVTDFTVLNLLIQIFLFQEWQANTVSFSAAVIQNFMLNRLWTFPESQDRKISGQLSQFVLVSLVGLGINMLVFLAIHHTLEPYWIGWIGDQHLGFTASYNFAKAVAIGVVLFWNFGVNRLWTYRGL